MSDRRAAICLALCLLLGAGLRFTGLTRGGGYDPTSAAPVPAAPLHTFHPDERLVVDAARVPVDVLDPPFTVYGTLPVYLLRAALCALPGPAAQVPERSAYLLARLLAAMVSLLTLWATWHLGRRLGGPGVACLATLWLAVAPGALQQAHFYIVDGPFGLLSLLTLLAILRARERGDVTAHVVAGGLMGATAAVKLTGGLLGGVLLAALLHERLADAQPSWRGRALALRAALLDRRLWLAAAACLLTLVAFEPYLVADPGRILRTDSIFDFAASAAIADGAVVRPWTLVDVHTTPYLYHWTELLPLIVGTPLTVLLAAGLLAALWRHRSTDTVLWVWFGLYFSLVGGLHAKHVRYLIPLLPPLMVLAAAAVSRCLTAPRWRHATAVAVALATAWTAVYGLAFARIYRVEDARLQAGRWLLAHVPAGSRIAVEDGGYSLAQLISPQRYPLRPLQEIWPFATRGFLTCGAAATHLHHRLAVADYAVVVDANRYLQFTAVPEMLPALASFYEALVEGRLGFDVAARVQVPARLGGLDFTPPRPETSFVGYDHPTVLILRRRDDFEAAWGRWQESLRADPGCADAGLRSVVDAARGGDVAGALARLQAVRRGHDLPLMSLLDAVLQARSGRTAAAQADLARFREAALAPGRTPSLIPWATALSLWSLGDAQLATQTLEHGDRFDTDGATTARVFTQLGILWMDEGADDLAMTAYRQAWRASPADVTPAINLAWMHYERGELDTAIALNRELLARGPRLEPAFNLALACLAAGDTTAARDGYAQAVAAFGAEAGRQLGAERELRRLARPGAAGQVARRLLRRYWPASDP